LSAEQHAAAGGADPAAADGHERSTAAPDASADAHLIEHRIDSRVVYQGHFLHVRQDHVTLPLGGEATREYIMHPGAVMVVPILDDGRLVMERQYRYPLGQVMLEFPAGKLEPGEVIQRCGQRELLEETGYTARHWARACLVNNAVAYSDELIEIWFARGLAPGVRQLDHGESLDVVIHEEAELDALACQGRITDVKTLIGLQWLQKWRSGAWPLQWGPAI
jgi:ADP-ribose pyrophosphatase